MLPFASPDWHPFLSLDCRFYAPPNGKKSFPGVKKIIIISLAPSVLHIRLGEFFSGGERVHLLSDDGVGGRSSGEADEARMGRGSPTVEPWKDVHDLGLVRG